MYEIAIPEHIINSPAKKNHLSVMNGTSEVQRNWLYDYIDLPDFSVNSYSFKGKADETPLSTLNSVIGLPGYASASGKRLFLTLNLLNRQTYIPPKLKQRRSDIRRTYPYIDSDTIEYIIPEGMDIEYLPEMSEIKSVFGEYRSYAVKSDNKILYYRYLKMFKGTFPKNLYSDFIKFFYDISIADKSQAILIKKES